MWKAACGVAIAFLAALAPGAPTVGAEPMALPSMKARVWNGVLPPTPAVTTPRIYVLDCGTLINDVPEEYGLLRGEVKYVDMADMCFLIVHPQGTLLWDTGLNDNLVGRPLYETMKFIYGQIKFNTLRGQLADIGYTPDKITYLGLSHSHFDHVGNANLFAKSTWLAEKPEWDAMFGWKGVIPPTSYDEFKDLKTAKTVFVGPDYDVFGDGTVVIKQAFGHTPGHAVLAVKLRDTGNVILTGDLWHYPEEISLDRIGADEAKTAAPTARRDILAWAKANHAQIWGTHFMSLFATLHRSPDYYE